jgi:predicted  nucleic acid-binding Zn-ribbon protein
MIRMSDDPVLSALSRLESGMTDVGSRLTSLESRLTNVEAGLTGVQQSQTTLRVDVMARMDRLENKLTEMRDDITVNIGGTWQNREAINSTRGDLHGLGEQVNIMWRQIKRLEQQVREITGEP